MGDVCPGLLWSILWFFTLILLAWPFAFIISLIYVLLLPFSGCIDSMKPTMDSIFKFVSLPITVTENMVTKKPMCEEPENEQQSQVVVNWILLSTIYNKKIFHADLRRVKDYCRILQLLW